MENVRLIRWLYRLSSFLLCLEGALIFLFLVLLPLMITRQSYLANSPKGNGQRIEYDTTLSAGRTFGKGFSELTPDSQGQLIKKVERNDSVIVYYGENRQVITRLRLDSLRRLLHPTAADSVPISDHRQAIAYQQRLTRQIDSVLTTTPGIKIYRTPDRWLLQHEHGQGFVWSLAIPLYRMIWTKEGFDLPPGDNWRHTLTHKPYMYLEPNLDYRLPVMLRASIYRWSDLNSFIWPLLLVSTGWVLFYLAMLMLITQWFREIFADLLNGDFFGERIARRVQQSGWLFIGGFILKNVIDVFQPILVGRYLQTQGYVSYAPWIWSGPDHWSWLWAGLVLLAFAQIFRYGTQLQRENELTI